MSGSILLGPLSVQYLEKGPVAVVSLPLGAIRLTRRFLYSDPPTRREMCALRREVRHHVLDALSTARAPGHLVGLGGPVRALARMHLAAQPSYRTALHGLRLRRSDVRAIRERLERLPLAKRRRGRGLKAERADIIVAGTLALEELMLSGEYATLTVCTRGVRDGILWRETLDQPITDRS